MIQSLANKMHSPALAFWTHEICNILSFLTEWFHNLALLHYGSRREDQWLQKFWWGLSLSVKKSRMSILNGFLEHRALKTWGPPEVAIDESESIVWPIRRQTVPAFEEFIPLELNISTITSPVKSLKLSPSLEAIGHFFSKANRFVSNLDKQSFRM